MDELLAELSPVVTHGTQVSITGLAFASNNVKPGFAFFCIPGTRSDGHNYASDAVSRGATALVVERELDLDIPQYRVTDSRLALALASAHFYDDPTASFDCIGITGTNGKTTTTYLVEWIMRHAGKKTGLIGTVETRVAGVSTVAKHTTPESLDLQALFAQMRDSGVQTAVMEVSSHAIDLDRIAGTNFSVLAFSNLTQDHLDYHHDMETYFKVKERLFTSYPARAYCMCIDDEYGKRIEAAAREHVLAMEGAAQVSGSTPQIITTGFSPEAAIHPVQVSYRPQGTHVVFETPQGVVTLDTPLVGRFNVENIMLAMGIALAGGISLDICVEALACSPQVPGRLEYVLACKDLGFSVLVDYAHTPDAVEKALAVVRDITKGRVIVVFGCGGDRDRAKRPLMGHAALAADVAIVTSDNPRTEDPDAIIADILAGMVDGRDHTVCLPDRREAIRHAVRLAQPDDCILIAGKGHEDYQLVGSQVLSFDDRLVAAEELENVKCEKAVSPAAQQSIGGEVC